MVVDTKLYDILCIDPSADPATIKKAYRKLALQHHPDKGGSDEKFKEITSAYSILSDENLKARYDATGNVSESDGHPGGAAFDADILSHLFGGHFNMGGMGGNFNPFGGQQHHFNGPQRTSDTLYELQLTLEQIFTGKKKTISVLRTVICKCCKGQGGKNVKQCGKCHGSGVITMLQKTGPFVMQTQVTCTDCNGKGKSFKNEDICKECNGNTCKADKSSIEVNVPAGAPNGHRIVFKGMADENVGHETGDLIIVVREKPHSLFSRQGNDLFITLSIDLCTALVGGNAQFQHIDGSTLKVQLVKGRVIKPGDTIVHSNKGMPVMRSNGALGDLRIRFNVTMPSDKWAENLTDKNVLSIQTLFKNAHFH